jgi:membrane peptidoglycan carboxypeptidase
MAKSPDPAEPNLFRRYLDRRRRRRTAKKARLAAMSRKRRWGRRIGILGTWLLAFVTVIVLISVVLFYQLSDVPSPSSLPLPQVAEIQYADGSTMAKIGPINRTIVPLTDVPEQVRWDILAAEDRGFYTEPGVSIRGTLRAAVSDITGGDVQGGSGITQQYAKNAYLSDSRTLSRKLRELAIAVKLSREYSKDQILEFYLNTVYFGRGAYGIEAGARAFFGKDVSRLTVAQGAVLAALLRAPSYYDPSVHPAIARARWDYVINGMVSTGHLSQARANTLAYPKVLKPNQVRRLGASGPTALIVQRVLAELQAQGIKEKEVYARGLRIRTTIRRSAQHAALAAIKQNFAHLTRKQRNIKNALVAVDPSSGAIIAYYGGPDGRNYAGRMDYFDYAGLGSAAPGSSFKPYTLATALSQTLTHTTPPDMKPVTIKSIADGSQCTTIEGTKICNDPSDVGFSSSHVTVANAMKYSLNTTFDRMAAQVGPEKVAETAHRMGISEKINGQTTLQDADGTTAFGIGIGDYAVHPLDQAVGFATLADGGVRHDPYFVQQATASDGQVVYTHKDASAQAIDPKVANDVTLTLEPVADFSGDGLDGGRPNAAKTGTEGIEQGPDKGGNSSAWMVGYTPQVSVAVWVGSGTSTHAVYDFDGSNLYGKDIPGHTWKTFMDSFLAGRPKLQMARHQQITSPEDRTKSPSPTPSTSSSSPTPSTSSSSVPVSTPPSTPTSEPGSSSTSPTPSTSGPPSLPGPSRSSPRPSHTRSPSRSPTPTKSREAQPAPASSSR